MSNVQKWEKRIKYRRISTWAIVTLSSTLIVVILLTIYGLNVGNFVITVPPGRAGLSLSVTREFKEPVARLNAPGLTDIKDCTYEWIDVLDLHEKNGENNDSRRRYISYSFYLKNTSLDRKTLDYTYTIKMFDISRRVDSALRILVYQSNVSEDSLGEGVEKIFSKPQEYPSANAGEPEYHPKYTSIPFLSDTEVCKELTIGLEHNAIHKFTVILWLEGDDPQCTDDIKGGTLKMDMNIEIANEY